jgi:hypothetical protein
MRIIQLVVGLCLGIVICCLPVRAQTTSNIEGTVKDPHGAIVPGAEVKATSPSLIAERTAKSDENGFYRIAALPAGTYTVTVSRSGIANRTVQND